LISVLSPWPRRAFWATRSNPRVRQDLEIFADGTSVSIQRLGEAFDRLKLLLAFYDCQQAKRLGVNTAAKASRDSKLTVACRGNRGLI
jgi:hypothetical protein